MDSKIVKKCFLWNKSFSMRRIEKCIGKKRFKISTSMCIPSLRSIHETSRFRPNPPWVPPPPENRQTSIFLFYSLYTSSVTKNKFFTFPARLTPLGSRSRSLLQCIVCRRTSLQPFCQIGHGIKNMKIDVSWYIKIHFLNSCLIKTELIICIC